MKLPSPRIIPLLALSLCLIGQTHAAVLIDFNNYTSGSNLSGQPATGTQWSGGGSDFLISGTAGVGGSKAVVTAVKASGNSSSLFSPSGTDLPGFNGATSILSASFQFRFVTAPDATTTTVAAIQFGYDGADANVGARFYLTAEGRLGFNNGSGATLVNGFDINDTTTWTMVSATLNYSTQKFSFSINGTPYVTGGGTSAFDFRGASDASAFRLTDTGSANSKSVAFDNIAVNVVPEPSTIALSTLSVFFGLFIVRRRRALLAK